jgi:toxin-antitoxin system PIN domain toxin
MIDLPDVNVWLALVDGNHTHHLAASHYWHEQSGTQTAFCRVSMLGFLRLSTQPRVLSRTLSHAEAWHIYRRYLALREVCFLVEPADTDLHFARLTLSDAMLHRLWTDAYLAAFAITARCRLVSFDRDFQRFPGLDFLHLSALPQS